MPYLQDGCEAGEMGEAAGHCGDNTGLQEGLKEVRTDNNGPVQELELVSGLVLGRADYMADSDV